MRSLRSILLGLVILLGAAALLFWNEGRTLAQAQALAEGERVVTSVGSDAVDPKHESKLIHLTGHTTAVGALRDGDLGVEASGLRLGRKVEMLQWKESRNSRGGSGGTEADFTYGRTWSAEPIDWTKFRVPQDHRNPPMPAVASHDFIPDEMKLGAFRIGDEIIAKLGAGQPFNPPNDALVRLEGKFGRPVQAIQGGLFAGADPAEAHIGDVRILYTLLPHQTVSVVGRQSGDQITAYKTSNGDRILLARAGKLQDADMFDFAQGSNTVMGWGMRFFGMIIIYLGCRVVLHPLRVIASYIPLVDSLAGLSAGIVALAATLVIAPIVIGLAWLAYRPLATILVVGSGFGLAWGVLACHRRNRPPVPAGTG